VFYGKSTQDRSICANLPGGITGSGVEDSQRGTYTNIQLHADTMDIHMQRQTTGMPYLLGTYRYYTAVLTDLVHTVTTPEQYCMLFLT